MKMLGYSDRQLGYLVDIDSLKELYNKGIAYQKDFYKLRKQKEKEIRDFRFENNIIPGYRLVDTCGGEFEAYTPYYYSSYDDEDESRESNRKKIMILGGGPNRIGQGIEFDYCCCHASYALKEEGIDSIMINSNPETVSTDYDTSDRLYFEPLTLEDILHIYNKEKPDGVIVQFGGQTPLRLAKDLEANGVKIMGTSPDSIDRAEDRERFSDVVKKLGLLQPDNGIAFFEGEALKIASLISYPVLVRPSYVLGGRAMSIIYDEHNLIQYIKSAVHLSPEHPILIDKFLDDAVEIDVDAVCDGYDVFIGAIMEHIEQAGVHSGDSACMIPTMTIKGKIFFEIIDATKKLARELQVMGLINIQFAVKDDKLYVIEVNPRASRTVPFVSKSIGIPLAKIAVKIMIGKKLRDYKLLEMKKLSYVSVKEAVLPFNKFPGVDIILSPEMKSTGEVMGIADNFGESYYKAEMAAGDPLPRTGTIFLSVNRKSKKELLNEFKILYENGYRLIATEGTADFINNNNIPCERILKVSEGRPNIIDLIKNKNIDLIINTPTGKIPRYDAYAIRQAAVRYHVPVITTVAAAKAAVRGLAEVKTRGEISIKTIQEYHLDIS
jgi:carbamoyl-phosphate synthase large subunit